MVETVVTIIIRGVGMVLLIVGGIASLHYGFGLYKTRAGAQKDLAAFEIGPVKIRAHSAGSIVMATAFVWGWAGVMICPSLQKSGGTVLVTSGMVWAPSGAPSAAAVEGNPGQLQSLFSEAIRNQPADPAGTVQVNGQPAQYDPSSIKVRSTEPGKYAATVTARSGSSAVEVEFKPQMVDGKLAFVPAAAEKSSPSGASTRPTRLGQRKVATPPSPVEREGGMAIPSRETPLRPDGG